MKINLEKILCATDFTSHSRRVLHYGIGLAGRFSSRLLIFHSIYAPTSRPDGTGVVEVVHSKQEIEKQALFNIEEIMAGRVVDWEPVIAFGEPAEEAARVAREQNVDLVVTASQGLSGLKRFLLGTVVERLARNLRCPILVVHAPRRFKEKLPRDPPDFKLILLGVNYPPDQETLKYTLALAREYQSRVQVLHCLEAPRDDSSSGEIEATYSKAQRSHLESLKGRLNERIPKVMSQCCNLETVLVLGNPGDQLYLSAARNKADLIVIGARPQSIWEKLVNFSTTEAVLRNAPCPVLVIPIRKEDMEWSG